MMRSTVCSFMGAPSGSPSGISYIEVPIDIRDNHTAIQGNAKNGWE
jgi:hypothetical protein